MQIDMWICPLSSLIFTRIMIDMVLLTIFFLQFHFLLDIYSQLKLPYDPCVSFKILSLPLFYSSSTGQI